VQAPIEAAEILPRPLKTWTFISPAEIFTLPAEAFTSLDEDVQLAS